MEVDEFINNVNDLVRLLLARSNRAYDIGLELTSLASRGMLDKSVDALAEPLFLIWASLTESFDEARGREPNEDASASSMMIRAAKEWTAISSDATGRELYFDRWMYEECGYERRSN